MNRSHSAFNASTEPFGIVMDGLKDEVDGEHFRGSVADDVVIELLSIFPGFVQRIERRKASLEWFAGCANVLRSVDSLRACKSAQSKNGTVLDYALHGMAPRPANRTTIVVAPS